mgnify:CR=1 FL=1
MSHDITAKVESEKFNIDYMLPGPAVTENVATSGRQTPHHDFSKKSRKSARISLMGYTISRVLFVISQPLPSFEQLKSIRRIVKIILETFLG